MTLSAQTTPPTNPVLIGTYIRALGRLIAVTAPVDHADLFNRLISMWGDSAERPAMLKELPEPGRPVVHLALTDDSDHEQQASYISSMVTQSALNERGGQGLLLHAAGLAREDGATAVIVGPSGRGKTTTTLHLAKRLAYVTDEAVCVNSDDTIDPYRKPLSVITPGHRFKAQVPPDELGLCDLPASTLTLGALILLERGDQVDSHVESVPLAEGIIVMVEQSSHLVSLDAPLQRIAALASATGGIRRLVAGEPHRIPAVADDLFVPRHSPVWEPVLPVSGDTTPANAAASAFNLPPSDDPHGILDAIECDDGTVLLTRNQQALHLRGVGPLLWRGVCAGDDWDRLAARAEAEHGRPASGTTRAALETAASSLVDSGILIPNVR